MYWLPASWQVFTIAQTRGCQGAAAMHGSLLQGKRCRCDQVDLQQKTSKVDGEGQGVLWMLHLFGLLSPYTSSPAKGPRVPLFAVRSSLQFQGGSVCSWCLCTSTGFKQRTASPYCCVPQVRIRRFPRHARTHSLHEHCSARALRCTAGCSALQCQWSAWEWHGSTNAALAATKVRLGIESWAIFS